MDCVATELHDDTILSSDTADQLRQLVGLGDIDCPDGGVAQDDLLAEFLHVVNVSCQFLESLLEVLVLLLVVVPVHAVHETAEIRSIQVRILDGLAVSWSRPY